MLGMLWRFGRVWQYLKSAANAALYFVPMVGLFFYPYNKSPVVGLALSIAFQLCMLLAAYNTEVALVGLRRKVRTVG